jgi:hypothetical protein
MKPIYTPAKLKLNDHVFSLFALVLFLFIFLLPIALENRTLIDSADIFDYQPWKSERPKDVQPRLGLDASSSYFFHPSDLLARDLFRRGRGFAWNPYVGFGAPWIGGMQGAPYFPPKILQWILPFWEGADLVRILLLLAAGVGTYLLIISLGLDQAAALVSAVGYMFCERLFVSVNMSSFHVETLLPLMLFGVHRMVTFRSMRYAIFAGWIGATQFLGGFPESSFIFCLVSVTFFSYLVLQPSNRFWWKPNFLLGIGTGVIALLLGGFQLAEFLRYLKLANHVHGQNTGLAVHAPADLIHLFAPYYFGFPLQQESHQWSTIPAFDHMRMTLFCGVTTVILAIIGVVGGHSRRGRWYFLGCLVFFAGYDYGFVGLRMIGHLPLFNVSSTVWNAWIIPFTLSILAGYGMHTVLTEQRIWRKVLPALIACIVLPFLCMLHFPKPPPDANKFLLDPEIKWILFSIIGILIALGWSRHERFKWSTSWLILIILIIELYNVDGRLGFLREKTYAANPASLDWFLKTFNDGRILGLHGIYPADMLLPSRVRDIRHMDAMYPKLYVDFVDAVWPGASSDVYVPGHAAWRQYDSKLLDLAAVRYVFSPVALPATSTSLIDPILEHSKITTFDERLVNGSGAFEINGSRRRVLFQHPPSTVEYQARVPPEGELLFSIGEEPAAWQNSGSGTIFEIAVGETPAGAQVRYHRFYDPKHDASDRRWIDGRVDLSEYAGKMVSLFLVTKSGRDGSGSNASAWDGWAGLRWGPEKFTSLYSDASTYIYRNNNAVDRARFVPAYRLAEQSFRPENMRSPSFDIRRDVFLKGYSQPSPNSCPPEKVSRASVATLQDEPDFTRFKLSAPCDGFFVLADLYFPGWKATVDGRSVRIYNANYAFRALRVSAGDHEITFTYAPWPISIGMPVACLTLIGSSLLMWFAGGRKFDAWLER